MPGEVRGEQIPLAVRVMHVAQDADMAWQTGGPQLAERVVASRAGSGLDPRAAEAFLAAGEKAFADLDQPSVWDVALAASRAISVVGEPRLNDCLSRWLTSRTEEHVDTGHAAAWPASRPRPPQCGDVLRRGAPVVPGGTRARHRPGHRPGTDLGQARAAQPRRARAGPAARLSQRAGPRRGRGAAAAGPAGRLARRAVRRLRLSPGCPCGRPAACRVAARTRTAITRCARPGRTGPRYRRRRRPTRWQPRCEPDGYPPAR